MGASSSAINPTQDFSPKMGGGRLFDMGASAVKYGVYHQVVASASAKCLLENQSCTGHEGHWLQMCQVPCDNRSVGILRAEICRSDFLQIF